MIFLINLCENSDYLTILLVIKNIVKLICIIAPIILLVMLSIDFGKNVISGSEDEMRKNMNTAIKRIIYCIAVFLAPTIVGFALNLLPNTVFSNVKSCVNNANQERIALLKEQEEKNLEEQKKKEQEQKEKEEKQKENNSELEKELQYTSFEEGSYVNYQDKTYKVISKEQISENQEKIILKETQDGVLKENGTQKEIIRTGSKYGEYKFEEKQTEGNLVDMEPVKSLTEELKNQKLKKGEIIIINDHPYKIIKISTPRENETYYTIKETDAYKNIKESAKSRIIKRITKEDGTVEFSETFG